MPYHKPKSEIAISAEEMLDLRRDLSALTIDQIADLLKCGRTTFYAWMHHGVPDYQKSSVYNIRSLQKYMDEHGRKLVLETKVVPVKDRIRYRDRQCKVIYMKGSQTSRCSKPRTHRSDYCYNHKLEILHGTVYMTIDGTLVGNVKDSGSADLPQQCIAIEKGGLRCSYMGEYKNGLCKMHERQLKKKGFLRILEKGLVRTIYAD